MIDNGGFFRHAERIGQRQHLYCQANPYAFGTSRHSTGRDERGSEDSALRPEMRLPQPEGVETQVFSHLPELKPFLERVELRCTFTCAEHGEEAEVHRHLLFSLIPHYLRRARTSAARAGLRPGHASAVSRACRTGCPWWGLARQRYWS